MERFEAAAELEALNKKWMKKSTDEYRLRTPGDVIDRISVLSEYISGGADPDPPKVDPPQENGDGPRLGDIFSHRTEPRWFTVVKVDEAGFHLHQWVGPSATQVKMAKWESLVEGNILVLSAEQLGNAIAKGQFVFSENIENLWV